MSWINNFTLFQSLKHLRNMEQINNESFLTILATQRKVYVTTHRHATITPVMVLLVIHGKIGPSAHRVWHQVCLSDTV